MGARDGGGKLFAEEERTPVYVFIGYLVSLLMGILGSVVGGYAGWMLKEGSAVTAITVTTGVCGFLLFFGITFALAGPGVYHYGQMTRGRRSPEFDRATELGHSSFHLYVTVHKVKDLYRAGAFGVLAPLPTYVEVLVGRLTEGGKFSVQRKPATATCHSVNGSFEEFFHFVVMPTDDTIKFVVRDRDVTAEVFSEPVLGECSINISDEVVRQGFPQRRAFELQRQQLAGERAGTAKDLSRVAGTLVVSFAPGEDCQLPVQSNGVDRRLAHEQLQDAQGLLLSNAGRTGYGTWASGRG